MKPMLIPSMKKEKNYKTYTNSSMVLNQKDQLVLSESSYKKKPRPKNYIVSKKEKNYGINYPRTKRKPT